MDKKLVELIFGASLHDIGKVIQRSTNQKVKHSLIGANFLKAYPQLTPIINQVRYHHAQEINNASLDQDDLAYITYIADNISSGIDRRTKNIEEEQSFPNWDTHTNQEDIFNRIYENEHSVRYYSPLMLDDRNEINKAQENQRKFNPGDYQAIVQKYKDNLPTLQLNEKFISSLLSLLEGTLTYVPSSTDLEQSVDISLFDHSKLTAGLATSIFHYLEEQNISNYHDELFKNTQNFYTENAFRLLSIDISGIQTFIYTIRDQRAARMLRSRSFYLEIFLENLLDELLSELNQSRANVLYTGGGQAYIITPNTKKAQEQIKEVDKSINTFLREQFGHELYVAIGSTPFSANDAMGVGNTFGNIYHQVSQEVSKQKIQRYTATDILTLNAQGKKVGRECKVCQTIHSDEESEICLFCEGLIQFSPQLQKNTFLLINEEESQLPVGFNRYLHSISQKDLIYSDRTDKQRTYSKNKFFLGENQSIHLWVGEYMDTEVDGRERQFDEYAVLNNGIDRLAVVRCDVDDLGQAFITGFSNHFNTLSRSATFSRSMSLFFKFHINQILNDLETSGTIIYSGGDDVFVLGNWFDMIEFAIKLREEFIDFSQGKLTLSTGIGLYPKKTPISVTASETGYLEESAKDNGKDSISLFTPEYTFKWDDFIQNIWNGKYLLIQDFFEENRLNTEYGKSFIYNLLSLIRKSKIEIESTESERGAYKTISWARWAYYLSRLEPSEPSLKDSYRKFTRQLHTYFSNEKDVKELEVALELFIYTIRGEE